jgi:hypothetical protein
VSVPEEGVLLYRRREEEEGMNLDTADHHNSHGRLDSTRPQPGEARRASARAWHALLLLPTSQVVHHWSTL